MFRIRLNIIVISLVLICGCRMPQYKQDWQKIEDEGKYIKYHESLTTFPIEFTARQYILLRIGKKEYDFTGIIVMRKDKTFRVVALGDMGGKFFEFLYMENEFSILTAPEKMPVNPLKFGVCGDIMHITKFRSNRSFCYGKSGEYIVLINRQDEDSFEEFKFKDNLLVKSLSVEKGKVIRAAEYSNYKMYTCCNKPLPAKIKINNYQWSYEIEINLIDIISKIKSERIFKKP